MHQLARSSALLGGQQALRLQQLQSRSEDLVHRTHLQRVTAPLKAAQPPAASRTVEAILDARRQPQLSSRSTAQRLRNKIDDARGGVHTERSERPELPPKPHAPLVPPLSNNTYNALTSSSPGPRYDDTQSTTRPPTTTTTTRRKIGAMRRRTTTSAHLESPSTTTTAVAADVPRSKLPKRELAWLEKQLQFTQRVAVLERECESWWRQFASSSGVATAGLSVAIQRSFDELPSARAQDARLVTHQLSGLRRKLTCVAHKLHAMRNGETYYAELQQLIEELEAALTAFRRSQRDQFDALVVDERLLENELSAFVERMSAWETADRPTRETRATSHTKLRDDSDRLSNQRDDAHVPTTLEADVMTRVRRLNELIAQSGGVRGGWDEREHGVFTSLLTRFGLTDDVLVTLQEGRRDSDEQEEEENNTNETQQPTASGLLDHDTAVGRFLHACAAKVVTRSADAVRGHWLWYLDHVQLLQLKRAAVGEWKERKAREREQLRCQGLVGESEPETRESAGVSLSSPCRLKTGDEADADADERRRLLAAASKAKKAKLLSEWREEKRGQEEETRKRERALVREKDAQDAKVCVERGRRASRYGSWSSTLVAYGALA